MAGLPSALPFLFMKLSRIAVFFLAISLFCSCKGAGSAEVLPNAFLMSFRINGVQSALGVPVSSVPLDNAVMEFELSENLDGTHPGPADITVTGASSSSFEVFVHETDKSILVIRAVESLPAFKTIRLRIPAGKLFGVNLIDDISVSFTTEYDPSDKFPRISDDELFEKVQRAAFGYFWDYAHPVSGLSRERLGSGDTVTSGGSGFGLMTIPVGIERGWISREEGVQRVLKTVKFLAEKAERFHGAWPHWLNGSTGKAIAFSTYDNGADLVETAFMIEGLLTLKHYFNGSSEDETAIRNGIQSLWESVEWDWFRQDGQNRLYWHWSPNYGWKMNMAISGWNEAMIVYVLAAASPTHSIDKKVYDEGWTRNGANKLNYRSPLFFTHYSFLGLDPRWLKDEHFDYWAENTKMAQTNHDYCASKTANGYSDACWGLTASDYSKGYTASSPNNDKGTVAPTAALASFPYVPELSKKAMEYFYYVVGDRLWGDYGFRDAFSLKDNWFASSYIAIDEGPIVVMMENYRTGLLWNCFMQDGDVQAGLTKLGFTWK